MNYWRPRTARRFRKPSPRSPVCSAGEAKSYKSNARTSSTHPRTVRLSRLPWVHRSIHHANELCANARHQRHRRSRSKEGSIELSHERILHSREICTLFACTRRQQLHGLCGLQNSACAQVMTRARPRALSLACLSHGPSWRAPFCPPAGMCFGMSPAKCSEMWVLNQTLTHLLCVSVCFLCPRPSKGAGPSNLSSGASTIRAKTCWRNFGTVRWSWK